MEQLWRVTTQNTTDGSTTTSSTEEKTNGYSCLKWSDSGLIAFSFPVAIPVREKTSHSTTKKFTNLYHFYVLHPNNPEDYTSTATAHQHPIKFLGNIMNEITLTSIQNGLQLVLDQCC